MVAKKPTNYSLTQAMTDIAGLRNQLGTPYINPIYLADQIADPSDPGAGSTVYSLTGNLKYTSWVDGNNYDTGRYTQITTSQQTYNTGSGQAMTGLSFNVGIGTYCFSLYAPGTTGAAAGNATINFLGPSSSVVAITALWAIQQSFIIRGTTSFAGALTSTGLTSGAIACWAWGTFTTTAAGNFQPQGTGASADTWATLVGTTLSIFPVTA
jgi:hypothetical protein